MEIIPLTELNKHSSHDDCWIVIHSKVYDVSRFLAEHPGSQSIILKYAGKDATAAYDEVHAPGIAEESLPEESLKGLVEATESAWIEQAAETMPAKPTDSGRPPLRSLISVHDFEDIARERFTKKTFAF